MEELSPCAFKDLCKDCLLPKPCLIYMSKEDLEDFMESERRMNNLQELQEYEKECRESLSRSQKGE